MNFGSKYVYYYDRSDTESLSADSDSADDDNCYEAPPPQSQMLTSAGLKSRSSLMSKLGKFGKVMTGRSKKKSAGSSFQTDGGPPLQHDGPQAAHIPPSQPPAVDRPVKKKKKVRKADPNVFTVSVGKYVTVQNPPSRQKIVSCGACKAVLPSFSKFEAKGEDNNWLCEFCRNYNRDVDVEGWTKPTQDDITYELKPPDVVDCKEKKPTDKSNIIFVIDISGSMGCSMECDQVGADGRRTRTFVSRLDAVKKAAEHQMRQIRDETPNVGVGLISFGSRVGVYGDGTTPVKFLDGADIATQERLKAVASDFPQLKPIKDTFNALTNKLVNLDIRGSTALGPGLLSGISLAANVKGSKVIICTDGCANVGFGALPDDYCTNEEQISSSRAVYKGFGDYARDMSVTVCVISLEGTDCRLVHLGMVAQITGGVVDIVDPANMSTQFGNVLASRTLATDVTVNMILYHTLYIRDFQSTEQASTKVEHLGNVDEDSEIVVEFGVKTVTNENEEPMTITDEEIPPPPVDDEEKMLNSTALSDQQDGESSAVASGSDQEKEVNVVVVSSNVMEEPENNVVTPLRGDEMETADTEETQHPSELPFQVQIEFTGRDGGKYLRVITNVRESTDRREQAESEMNMNIVGAATSNTVSNVALTGDYEAARGAIQTRKKMTERYANVMPAGADEELYDDAAAYVEELDDLEQLVTQQQRTSERKAQRWLDSSGFSTDGLALQHDSFGPLEHDSLGPLEHDGPSGPAPVYYGRVRTAGMVQPAGMLQSAGMSRSVVQSAKPPSKGAASNFISDDLAYEYYARSKGSYAQKKKMKGAKKQ